jgi:SAM-dependent methyltransferase
VSAYDEVLYPGRPFPQTHPDRMAAVATLAGMHPAPVGRCRVLEVACGDGSNVIPMAHGLPESEFVGFDLAARPIDRAKELAGALGVKNLALHTLDLADFPPAAGRFDYIVAHGLYSWIPAAARDRLLALVADHLAPQGVAYVSYNVYPGCYVRRMAWEMLRFHTRHLADPRRRIAGAQELARLLATGRRADDRFSAPLAAELDSLLEREAAHLLHDDLAEINEPVYFHELNAHAQRHGLQFLGEAELAASGDASVSPSARRALEALDPLTREQYLDFILCRRFRQTLLCRRDAGLDPSPGPGRITTLFLAARGRVSLAPREPHDTEAPEPAEGATTRETAEWREALLDALGEAAPRRLAFDEVAAMLGAGEDRERGRAFFPQVVLGAARAGAVVLHTAAPRMTTEPGERPLASPIARQQIATGSIVTTLCHDSVSVDHETARRLLPLLDGTRTRRALASALGTALDGDSAAAREATLDAHLRHLGTLALLCA